MVDRIEFGKLADRLLAGVIERTPDEPWRYALRMTSGTSGKPLVTVVKYGMPQFKKFAAWRRIVMCFGTRDARLANVLHIRNQVTDYIQTAWCIDPTDIGPDIGALVADFAPDNVGGLSSFVGRLASVLGQGEGESVRTLQLVGERVSPQLEKIYREHFSNARIIMAYIASEIGLISTQGCVHLPVNHYHPGPGVTIEIVDQAKDGAGDLLVSKRLNDEEPLERYYLGDSGRWVKGACQCKAAQTFEHLGRKGYDYIKFFGALVRHEEFARVVEKFKPVLDDYRVEVSSVLHGGVQKGKIVLRGYRRLGPPTKARCLEIAGEFSREVYLTPTRTLSDLVEEHILVPLAVEYSVQPFTKKHKDIKLVDLR